MVPEPTKEGEDIMAVKRISHWWNMTKIAPLQAGQKSSQTWLTWRVESSQRETRTASGKGNEGNEDRSPT